MTATATHPVATGTTGRLRLWFAADAVVSGLNGLAYLVLAGPLAELFGAEAGPLRELGLFLVVYAVGIALYARGSLAPRLGWAIVAGNAVWVLASLDVALTGAFGLDTAGRVWAVAQALVVADLALLQGRALRCR